MPNSDPCQIITPLVLVGLGLGVGEGLGLGLGVGEGLGLGVGLGLGNQRGNNLAGGRKWAQHRRYFHMSHITPRTQALFYFIRHFSVSVIDCCKITSENISINFIVIVATPIVIDYFLAETLG